MSSSFRRAVWMDIERDIRSPEDAAEFVAWCRRWDIGLAFPCVNHCRGGVTYPSDLVARSASTDTWDPTAEVARRCKDAGIECHVWVCIACWGPAKLDPAIISPRGPKTLQEAHPEWFCVDQTGLSMLDSPNPAVNRLCFVNLCREDVHDFHVRLCTEILERYPFDGYHLDYIRFTFQAPEEIKGAKEAFTGGEKTVVRLPGTSRFSFDEATLRAFRAETGSAMPGPETPLAERVACVYANEARRDAWYAWKASKVTALVRRLHAETARLGRKLSAAVFGGYPWCGQEVAQRWPGWVDEGILDLAVPMDYGLEPDAFVATLDSQQAALKAEPRPAVPFIAGVYSANVFDKLAPEGVLDKVRQYEDLARRHTQSGLCLFCYGSFRKLLK